jgi:hypothetical protein
MVLYGITVTAVVISGTGSATSNGDSERGNAGGGDVCGKGVVITIGSVNT